MPTGSHASGPDTPVCLLIFRRPELTARVFAAVRQARPSRLFVVADGPRPDQPQEAELCARARAATDNVDWPCQVERLYAPVNLGLRDRMRSGLDHVFARVEEAIILEDDCLIDASFFRYCRELLDRYRDDPGVMLIGGDNALGYPARDSYFFTRYPLICGWATWRRAWALYDDTLSDWPERRESGWLEGLFPHRRAADYWRGLFDESYRRSSSWARPWVYACLKAAGLCALPAGNLTCNIGFGQGAAHTEAMLDKRANTPVSPMRFPLRHPAQVQADPGADAWYERRLYSGDHTPLSLDIAGSAAALDSLGQGRPWRALRLLDELSDRLAGFPGADLARASVLAGLGLWERADQTLKNVAPGAEPVRQELERRIKAGVRASKERLTPSAEDRQDLARLLDLKPRSDLIRLGGGDSGYGAWVVAAEPLGPESVCCLAGAGEDITFDCALAARFGCRVVVLDPTPRSVAHVRELGHRVSAGPIDPADPVFGKYAGLTPEVFARITHHPLGLFSRPAVLRFHAPANPEHVSHSIFNLQKTQDAFEAPCLGVADLPWLLGSNRIDLLKIDIEGAEYAVLEAIIDAMPEAGLDVRQLCVEFDEGYQPLDRRFPERLAACVAALKRAGYVAVCLDGWNVTFMRDRTTGPTHRIAR